MLEVVGVFLFVQVGVFAFLKANIEFFVCVSSCIR